jgi:hypothetical protein
MAWQQMPASRYLQRPWMLTSFVHVVQAAFRAAGHENGKENSMAQVPNGHPPANGVHSPSKSVPTTWDAFCRASLSGTAAQAVLRVSSK